ncbi:cysteine desulfurase NifS [Thalassospira sp. MA62]|nr:cysteine desulfurase NifS [Thalassospira sp. MA62]
MQPIYFDNNATTRPAPGVVDAMLPFLGDQFGNASSSHAFGADVAPAVRTARQHLQALLGCDHDHELIFTSGGTESDNSAILSALEMSPDRDQIVTSAVEHPAILSCLAWLEKRAGITVTRIGVDGFGRLDLAAYQAALGPKTALVTMMWGNNETGTLFPIKQLAAQAHAVGALFHTDAVQVVGKMPIDLSGGDIDMLSLSGHKFHGPKGVGALYVRKGIKFQPLIRGGRQERGRRAGTENVPGIVGMGKAAEIAQEQLMGAGQQVAALRDRLETGLLARISHCQVLGDVENRLGNTSNIAFDGIESEAILHHLEKAGIAASSGSACASGSMEPSHVLRAMNVAPVALQGAIRFSLSRDNRSDEIDRLLDVMPAIVEDLRAKSPLWQVRYGDQAKATA